MTGIGTRPAPFDHTTATQVYRALLSALARPGRRERLPDVGAHPAILPLLTLADNTTRIGVIADEATTTAIVDQTGAQVVDVALARYVCTLEPLTVQLMSAVAVGTVYAPEDAALVITAVDTLESGAPMIATGPGIDGAIEIAPPIADDVWQTRSSRTDFPVGPDLVIVAADGSVLGIPRSTRLTPKEN